MAVCTTRTLEGMYIFSNPPKAVAAPVSLKQAGKPEIFRNYKNSTIANNYRSVYSPNHFISGRPLSGYWWREKKETYEQEVNAALPEDSIQSVNKSELQGDDQKNNGRDLLDAVCQTDAVQNVTPVLTHTSSQTSEGSEGTNVRKKNQGCALLYLNFTGCEESKPSSCKQTSQLLIAQAERMAEGSDNLSLEIATRILSHSYMEDMIPNMLQKMEEHGYLETAESSEKEDVAILPWLMNELELGLSRLEKTYNLLTPPAAR